MCAAGARSATTATTSPVTPSPKRCPPDRSGTAGATFWEDAHDDENQMAVVPGAGPRGAALGDPGIRRRASRRRLGRAALGVEGGAAGAREPAGAGEGT